MAEQCITQTMNTSPHNLRCQKRIARKQKLRDRAMKGVAERERLRMERAADEPQREEWRGRLEMTVTFHDRRTGEIHSLDLSRGQRRDQYDASVDGTPWKRGISATELARFFRMKLKPHICRA